MAQPILVGLIAAMGMLAASILTLVGVLWNTNTQFKLGKRKADLEDQSANDKRAFDLSAENAKLRTEIDTLREKTWNTEHVLREKIRSHEDAALVSEGVIPSLKEIISGLKEAAAEQKETISGLTAQTNIALLAQERAEGGLTTAMKTIHEICPPPERKQEAL